MNLTTLSFVYLGLPVMLAVYLLLPRILRPGALLLFSLGYYFLLYPDHLPLLVASVAWDFLAICLLMRLGGRTARRAVLVATLSKSIACLFWTGAMALQPRGMAIVGVLVYTLSGVDAVVSAYGGALPSKVGPVRFGAYCCFFPSLTAGPLMAWRDFDRQLSSLETTPVGLVEGLCTFLLGAVKYLLPGNYLGVVHDTVRLYGADASVLSHWCMVVTLALSVFYLYSGLCDMARGVGQMLGLRLPRNFYYPYQSRGILDFSQRFNSTVNTFLTRHVYDNLRGERENPPAEALSMLLVGMLLGLWFGLRINYLAWGAALALVAVLERYLLRRVLEQIPTLFCRLYALFVVLVSFVLFAGETLGQSWGFFLGLFGLADIPLYNNRILYLLTTNWALLTLSCLFATNLFSLVAGWVKRSLPKTHTICSAAAALGLLVLVTALLLY